MTRDLLNYLPPAIRDVKEYQEIMTAEQPEIIACWESADDGLSNQFIVDAGEYGVSRWEKILKIRPKSEETLLERKSRILARLRPNTPYTYRVLAHQLDIICGDEYSLIVDADNYTLTITLGLVASYLLPTVKDLVARMIPANMITNVILRYNTHGMLSSYTHSYLSQFTHIDLKMEDLSNGD